LFDVTRLQTAQNEQITIKKQGFLNTYDGPDFSDANVKIGDLDWHGTVEIHIKDTDWLKHGHQNDGKYKNVILHVVWEVQNQEAIPKDIPCLILKNFVSPTIIEKYEQLVLSKESLPCQNSLASCIDLDKIYALEEQAFGRMKRKNEVFYEQLKAFEFDWRQLFFYLFALALGKKVNKYAMEQVAKNLDFKILFKHRDEPILIESMVFGVAGMLEQGEGSYFDELKREFQFLKAKYSLKSIPFGVWNFSKVRGSAKPHLSLAILSSLVQELFHNQDVKLIDEHFLTNLKLSEYWQKNYQFDLASKTKNTISEELKNLLKINVIVPYLSLLGKYYDDESYFYRAQTILESLKPEQNSIIESFEKFGFKIENAFLSQGAIELKNEYCSQKRCLECHVGKKIIGK
jgi:hypothetical protein